MFISVLLFFCKIYWLPWGLIVEYSLAHSAHLHGLLNYLRFKFKHGAYFCLYLHGFTHFIIKITSFVSINLRV